MSTDHEKFIVPLTSPGNGERKLTAQERCQSRGGRPGLPVPNSPYGLCGRKATLNPERKKKEKERKNRDGTWFVQNSAGNIIKNTRTPRELGLMDFKHELLLLNLLLPYVQTET